MRKIPEKNKDIMRIDPFMSICCVGGCIELPQWHHPWIYARKQIVDIWATVPACPLHHNSTEWTDYFKWVSLNRATAEDLALYYKKNWEHELKRLNDIFGIYKQKCISCMYFVGCPDIAKKTCNRYISKIDILYNK